MKESILNDYLYSGVSFSTFKFDKLSYLSCKYVMSRIKFFKNYYLKKMYRLIYNKEPKKEELFQKEKYLAFQNMKALRNSNILISNDKKEIKLYRYIKKKKDADVSEDFSIEDLPFDFHNKMVCLFINNNEDKEKYLYLFDYFKNVKVIELDELEKENLIFDEIKGTILRDDESEIYFVGESIYANYIVSSAYTVNKIAINL